MREIKFRAWDNNLKKMILQEKTDRVDKIPYYYETHIKTTLMQYTGLKDKNCIDIYEGDIVKHIVHNVELPIIKVIEFWEGSFIAKPSYDGSQSYMSLVNFAPNRTMEVIGNIYANKELLNN